MATSYWYGNAFTYALKHQWYVGGPDWSASPTYLSGALVVVGGTLYQCSSSNTNQTPPNATYWTSLGTTTATTGTGPSTSRGGITYLNDDIRVMLCTSSYTPSKDSHAYKGDVGSEVAGATGYSAGGASLASKTITGPTSGVVTFDAADLTWSGSTITARYAVIYDYDAGSQDANRPLLGYVDFGANVSSVSGNFTIQWDALGILRVTV